MSALLELRHLWKIVKDGLEEIAILKDVSCAIHRGECVTLTGPSGSGKTTLLTLLGCLDIPSKGSVTIDGRNTAMLSRVQLADQRLHGIGFVFQDYNLIPTLTALENVEYVLWVQGKSSREQRIEATRVLTRVGLGDFLHRRPNRLSRGQQQRVAVSRAIVHRPQLILGDEVTANLDRATGMSLMDFLKQLNREDGITFVYATHDPAMMGRAERVLHLLDGKLVRDSGYIPHDRRAYGLLKDPAAPTTPPATDQP
ncbi:MAG: ABC transporter ATP-binding protein [Candidatus Omnitrophica bacterium]|nr:ABC transporter ATP-binding protein [Candidatus Omnitrophota bacterium]